MVHPLDQTRRIHFLADTSHLLKNLRMALINSGENGITLPDWLKQEEGLPSTVVNIKYIKEMYDLQCQSEIFLAPRLRQSTFEPNHFSKMCVKTAKSLFSSEVNPSLLLLAHRGMLTDEAVSTAWFVELIRKWYEILSSRHLSTKEDFSVMFLQRSIKIFASLKIGDQKFKPSQRGCIVTTKSVLELQDFLLKEGMEYVVTSRFLGDCIENFFSMFRYKNPTPSAVEFKQCVRVISISQFLKKKRRTNCEDDDNRFFLDEFLEISKEVLKPEIPEGVEDLPDSFEGLDIPELQTLEFDAFYYYVGICLEKIRNLCSVCDRCFSEVQSSDPIRDGLPVEYTLLRDYTKKALIYPSVEVHEMLLKCEKHFRSLTNNELLNEKCPKAHMIHVFNKLSQSVTLRKCHGIKEKIIDRFAYLRLRSYAKKIRYFVRDSMKGREVEDSRSMAMRNQIEKM